ncbi:hypothetical protein L195_g063297, partial [Trifolium pratense]
MSCWLSDVKATDKATQAVRKCRKINAVAEREIARDSESSQWQDEL